MKRIKDEEKTRDMVRSILPSKEREAARKAKAIVKRENRRSIRRDLKVEDPETTPADFKRRPQLTSSDAPN